MIFAIGDHLLLVQTVNKNPVGGSQLSRGARLPPDEEAAHHADDIEKGGDRIVLQSILEMRDQIRSAEIQQVQIPVEMEDHGHRDRVGKQDSSEGEAGGE